MQTTPLRMPGMPSLLRPWSLCFAAIALCVVMFMMLPGIFGFQKFTQWGGMYTDSWCRVDVYSGNPNTDSDVKMESVIASTVGPGAVYSAPMHNFETCLMWSRSVQCGRKTKEGWTVTWARPYFKKQYFIDPQNACDLQLQPGVEWFRSKL